MKKISRRRLGVHHQKKDTTSTGAIIVKEIASHLREYFGTRSGLRIVGHPSIIQNSGTISITRGSGDEKKSVNIELKPGPYFSWRRGISMMSPGGSEEVPCDYFARMKKVTSGGKCLAVKPPGEPESGKAQTKAFMIMLEDPTIFDKFKSWITDNCDYMLKEDNENHQ